MCLNPGIKPATLPVEDNTQTSHNSQGRTLSILHFTWFGQWLLKDSSCYLEDFTVSGHRDNGGPVYWPKRLWQRARTNLTLNFKWVKSCFKESSIIIKNLSCNVSWENESICEIQPHDLNLFFLYANIINQSSRLLASKAHVLRMFQGHSLWLPLI